MQFPLFELKSDWRPPNMGDLPAWDRYKRICIDCETRDEQLRALGPGPRRGAYTTGWAIAFDEGPSFYLPMRHQGGDNLDPDQVLAYMRDNARHFDGEIVGANLSYDLDYAANDEIEFHPNVKFRDIQIADPLIYELHQSYSLFNIGERWGVKGKDEDLLIKAAQHYGIDPKNSMWKLPARYVGAYASNDATSPLEIYAKQVKEIDKKELWQVFELESKVLPVLVKLRRRGVRIDQDRLQQLSDKALAQEKEFLNEIHHHTGVRIAVGDCWKPKGLALALDAIGVKVRRTPTGAPQIKAEALEKIDHPVAKAIRGARQSNKLRTTFVDSIKRYMVKGRIHCTFNQIARENEKGEQKGVRYGRLSAEDPNMQQMPSPDRDNAEEAKEFREVFLPEEDSTWGCNDYSQQEPRWTTSYAEKLELPKAIIVADRYREDPDTDNHHMMTEIIHGLEVIATWDPGFYKQNRAYAKDIYLGLCYGEGGAKLCKGLGLPTRWALIDRWQGRRTVAYYDTRHLAMSAKQRMESTGIIREVAGEEGQRILDQFDQEVPFVRKLQQTASNRAQAKGYVKTYYGRRLHFKRDDNGRVDWPHKALNRIIQGSSADQAKQALIDLDGAGYFIQLAVHDETDGSFESPDQAREAGLIMRDSVQIGIPFKVDTECGPNWGNLTKWHP